MFGNRRIATMTSVVTKLHQINDLAYREERTARFIEDSEEDKKFENWQPTKSGKTVATIIRLTIDLANEKSKESRL